jgi:hypothetical protein
VDRPETPAADGGKARGSDSAAKAAVSESASKPAAADKSKSGSKSKEKAATKAEASASAAQKPAAAANGKVGLLVRLYFSSHEKLSEQRWIERIPSEEPFKSASPKVIHSNDADFEETDQQFESLD